MRTTDRATAIMLPNLTDMDRAATSAHVTVTGSGAAVGTIAMVNVFAAVANGAAGAVGFVTSDSSSVASTNSASRINSFVKTASSNRT